MSDSNGNMASSSLKSDFQTHRSSCGSSTPACATRTKLDKLHTKNLSSPSGNLKSGQSQASPRWDQSSCLSEQVLWMPHKVVSRVIPRSGWAGEVCRSGDKMGRVLESFPHVLAAQVPQPPSPRPP